MSAQVKRILGIVLGTVALGVGIGLYVGIYLTADPGSARATTTAAGTHLYLATVPAAEASDAHPTWVSYYVVNPDGSHWRHHTTFVVPAHSLIHVTVYQYDGDSGLRNPFLAQSEGTVGGNFTLDGKTTQAINPDDASHIFAIPQLGVSVPLEGVPDSAKNPCGNAPCTLKQDHQTISFSFHTGARGLFRWQCFVPCAAGYIAGWGGPMQTVGYMDGYVKVV